MTSPTLAAERAYLAAARADLRAMREATLALDARGGDAVSEAYLAASLHKRILALADDPETPLFFGRLDLAAGEEPRYYVGRRHVHDDSGDPVVVDWRAGDLDRVLPRHPDRADGRRAAPTVRLRARRDHGVRGRAPARPDRGRARNSKILAGEIERPRVGPMRDIVATIQPEQDVIVRADVGETVCVQGAPGTGKTAVGLHRAAYLLYTFRDRLRRGGVLVVGPNSAFLSYISAVLPALGEVDVKQVTLEELVGGRVEVRAVEPAPVAALKGDPRMAQVLDRAVHAGLSEPTDALVLPRGSHRWRVPAHELRDIVAGLRARDVRYGAARAMLAQRLSHALLTKMEAAGDSPDDRVQDAVARSTPVRKAVDALWPAVDPVRVVMALLSDAGALARAADGILDPAEQALLLWPKPPRGPRTAPWSLADAVLSTRSPTCVDREPSLATSCWTRRRTSRRCSCAPSDAGAPRRPRRSWATSRRAPRRGPPPTGRSRSPTSASRTHTSRCCGAATGCRPPSSSSPAGCCRTSHPASARPSRCARTTVALDVVAAVDLLEVVASEVRRVLVEPARSAVVVADADVERLSAGLDLDLEHGAHRPRRRHAASHPGAGDAGQGTGVRPRRRGGTRRDSRRRAHAVPGTAAAVRRADPRRVGALGRARPAAA